MSGIATAMDYDGCGCYISTYMGSDQLYSVNFCEKHKRDQRVQKKLKQLKKIMDELKKEAK